jgi:MoxR-like ATPase
MEGKPIRVSQTFSPITTGLINREEEDRILNLAVLTKEHCLLVGPPGTAKSLQADLFFSQLEGSYFKAALTKFSGEEVVFGAINIKKLKNGIYEHCYEGSLLTANYGFLDEMFDASDALLRSLLSVLNERIFVRGTFSVKCPLITCVATANYSRINEVTQAVVDRFLFQWAVKPLEEEELKLLFDWQPLEPNDSKISLNVIKQAQKAVENIVFPEHLKDVFIKLAVQFDFTPRRVFKAIKICKASAYMSNRDTVTAEDLLSLKYLISTDPQQIADAANQISEVTVIAQRAYEQSLLIDEIVDKWDNIEDSHSSLDHLKAEAKCIKRLQSIDPVNEEIAQRKQKLLQQWQKHHNEHRSRFLRGVGLE